MVMHKNFQDDNPTEIIWPQEKEGTGAFLIDVKILLARTLYMSHMKKSLSTEEVPLLAAVQRAGPAILAGLEEGVR